MYSGFSYAQLSYLNGALYTGFSLYGIVTRHLLAMLLHRIKYISDIRFKQLHTLFVGIVQSIIRANKLPRSKLSRLGSPPTSWERGILFS
jgi:hypothetical protein